MDYNPLISGLEAFRSSEIKLEIKDWLALFKGLIKIPSPTFKLPATTKEPGSGKINLPIFRSYKISIVCYNPDCMIWRAYNLNTQNINNEVTVQIVFIKKLGHKILKQ